MATPLFLCRRQRKAVAPPRRHGPSHPAPRWWRVPHRADGTPGCDASCPNPRPPGHIALRGQGGPAGSAACPHASGIPQLRFSAAFGQYFCLHFEAFQLQPGGTGLKMICQGVPRSIIHSHRRVQDSYDGLIIQRNMALFFSGGDKKELKLRVSLTSGLVNLFSVSCASSEIRRSHTSHTLMIMFSGLGAGGGLGAPNAYNGQYIVCSVNGEINPAVTNAPNASLWMIS
ncbi:unnamed protein product [Miscanthus lutarioriparius]|uniref:Seven-in-absentia protein TRAF-like domain-containing protein n=1 Tax=Miscanthus lutarioriparius TaxID=422564 RepID=A0A811QQ74_9POAL|nr:unnamed protein product [Miscanthus lutarioriparius]